MASNQAASTVAVPPNLKLRPSMNYRPGRTTFLQRLGTQMVNIYVGPHEEHHQIHKRLLCQRIPYFNKMFNSGFKEASENTARLPEDDPDAFDMLVNWVYYGNIKCLETNVYPDGSEAMSWDPIAFYSLAEKICLPEIQDRIMDAVIKHHKKKDELPSIDFVHRAYTQTSSRSEMRSYALQGLQYVLSLGVTTKEAWPTAQMEKLFKDHHASFSHDFLAALRERDTQDPREEHRCVFHGHKLDEPCSADTTVKKSKRKASESLGHASKRSKIETPISPDASQHS